MSFEYLVILFLLLFLHSFLSNVITYICIIIEEKDLKLFYFFFVFGVIWDSFAIWRGHWSFPEGTLGVHIGLMPVEEYFFILIIPYFVITIYKLIDSKFKFRKK